MSDKPVVDRYDISNCGDRNCDPLVLSADGVYVEYAEYEALFAEVERLRTAEGDAMTYKAGMENVAQQRDQLKAEVESSRKLASEYARCADNECAEARKLKAENEALRKDLVDWQAVVAAVKREVPERFTSHARGNAPGHGHSISGVWDNDNGALAGKECAWCKAWSAAMSKADQ